MNPTFTGAEAFGREPCLAPDERFRSRSERCAVCGALITATTDPASWGPSIATHYRTVDHVRAAAREARP